MELVGCLNGVRNVNRQRITEATGSALEYPELNRLRQGTRFCHLLIKHSEFEKAVGALFLVHSSLTSFRQSGNMELDGEVDLNLKQSLSSMEAFLHRAERGQIRTPKPPPGPARPYSPPRGWR